MRLIRFFLGINEGINRNYLLWNLNTKMNVFAWGMDHKKPSVPLHSQLVSEIYIYQFCISPMIKKVNDILCYRLRKILEINLNGTIFITNIWYLLLWAKNKRLNNKEKSWRNIKLDRKYVIKGNSALSQVINLRCCIRLL